MSFSLCHSYFKCCQLVQYINQNQLFIFRWHLSILWLSGALSSRGRGGFSLKKKVYCKKCISSFFKSYILTFRYVVVVFYLYFMNRCYLQFHVWDLKSFRDHMYVFRYIEDTYIAIFSSQGRTSCVLPRWTWTLPFGAAWWWASYLPAAP